VINHFVSPKGLFELRFCCEYGCNRDVILFFLISKLVHVCFVHINITFPAAVCAYFNMARGRETIRQACCNWCRSSYYWKQKTYKAVCGYVDYFTCCSLSQNSRCRVLRTNDNTSALMQSLRPGWPGDRILVGARFSALVHIGPGAHPVSCAVGTGSFPGVKRPGRGVYH